MSAPQGRCGHWTGRERCPERAEVWLITDEGKPLRGPGECRAHAQAVIDEYRAKLGEVWTCSENRP